MALLRTWPGLLLPIMLLCACAGAPLPTRSAVASPDIGWIDRQFRICGGNDCPAPTRKTLALVDSLPARRRRVPPFRKRRRSPFRRRTRPSHRP
jgi:hypothetical protein